MMILMMIIIMVTHKIMVMTHKVMVMAHMLMVMTDMMTVMTHIIMMSRTGATKEVMKKPTWKPLRLNSVMSNAQMTVPGSSVLNF